MKNGKKIRELILATVSDCALNLVAYDRKDDEDLPREVFDKAIEEGVVTVDEMAEAFRKALLEHMGLEEEGR